MKRTFPVLLSAILLVSLDLLAQDTDPSQQLGSISGTVVDAVSGQPLAGAQVLARSGMGGLSSRSSQSTSSDSEGHFAFSKLAAGRYIVFASKDGYVPRDQGGMRVRQTFTLSPGQSIDDVSLPLLPGGIISGHVVDDKGKPIRGVSVHLMKSGSWGDSQLVDQNETTSNQAGEYRFGGITSGKYYLRAMRSGHVTVKPGAANQAYAPVCYPSTTDLSACVPLIVRPGEQLSGMDLSFVPVSAVRLTGKVLDARTSAPVAGIDLTVLRDEGGLFQVDEISPDDKGNFVFPSLPAGSYLLVAQRQAESEKEHSLWGSRQLEVRDKDLTDVRIPVSAGSSVSGHLRVESKTPVDLTAIVGSLEPENSALVGFMPDIQNVHVNPDGSFTFPDVPEGKYKIEFFPLPPGFYFKGAGGSDALDSGITVSRGQPYFGLEVILSSGTGKVEGTVSNNQQPAPGSMVLLVPEGSARKQPRDFRRGVTDSSGRFSMRSVPPGDYRLFAFESMEGSALSDPEFLRQYENNAAAVHVKDNEVVSVHVDVIPADTSQ